MQIKCQHILYTVLTLAVSGAASDCNSDVASTSRVSVASVSSAESSDVLAFLQATVPLSSDRCELGGLGGRERLAAAAAASSVCRTGDESLFMGDGFPLVSAESWWFT